MFFPSVVDRGSRTVSVAYTRTPRRSRAGRTGRCTDAGFLAAHFAGSEARSLFLWFDAAGDVAAVDWHAADQGLAREGAQAARQGVRGEPEVRLQERELGRPGRPVATDWPERGVPLDPKFLGLWLGDGTSGAPEITTVDPEILDYVTSYAAGLGLQVMKRDRISYWISTPQEFRSHHNTCDRDVVIAAVAARRAGTSFAQISREHGICRATLVKYIAIAEQGPDALSQFFDSRRSNIVRTHLQELDLMNNKRVPDCYKFNSRRVRLELLGGMIDTDGYLGCGGYDLTLSRRVLLEDFVQVARSLGFVANDVKQITKSCTNAPGGPKDCVAFKTRIMGGRELREIPLLLPRKRLHGEPRLRTDQLRFTISP